MTLYFNPKTGKYDNIPVNGFPMTVCNFDGCKKPLEKDAIKHGYFFYCSTDCLMADRSTA